MSDTKIHVDLGKFETPEESKTELENFTNELSGQALIMSGEEFKELTKETIQDAYNLGAYDNRCYSRKKIHKELTLVLYRKIDSELRERYEGEYIKKLDELKKENHDLKIKKEKLTFSFPWHMLIIILGTVAAFGMVLGKFINLF